MAWAAFQTFDSDGSGSVSVECLGDGTVRVYYDLSGLPAGGTGGLHIHSGNTCDEASLVGGHYYDSATVNPDPWTTMWTSNSQGQGKGSFVVKSGYGTYAENFGRTVVIHGLVGADKIGCMVLSEAARGGIHVHSGTTCSVATAVGGHFWNKAELGSTVQDDPWTVVQYEEIGRAHV